MNKLLKAFTRTKHLKPSDFKTTPLNRCLSTMDLAALGVSSTIGTGIYVLTGEVTRLKAGPSVILSFLIAALASMLCALCYAEFGARFPKAGSAYIYSYVTIGELCAFTIGWNLILEYVVGTAATARVWGSFCDALFNNRIQEFVAKTIGTIHAPLLAKYPDFLAFFAVVAVVAVVALGVKQSVVFNWFFLILNVVVILFVTIAGLCFADFSNWSDFFPFGFEGTMAGAAILFYSFVGFDVVASCGEEAQTPTKSIPNAIIGCLVFSFFAYLGVAAALSLMLPYNELTEYSSIATAFDKRGFPAGKYIVAAGATFALLSGIAGQLFPLPRIMYSMATDRVIFSFLGRINKRTETPLVACIIGGIVTGLLTLLLDLISLVEMLSIGTLLAYTIVALCVLLLRYRPGDAGIQIDRSEGSDEEVEPDDDIEITVEENASKNSKVGDDNKSPQKTNKQENGDQLDPISNQNVTPTLNPWTQFYHRVIGWQRTEPTQETYSTVKVAAFVFVVLSIILLGCLIYGLNSFTWMHPSFSAIGVFLVVAILFVVQIIASQPQSKSELPFKVRFVPLVPLLSVFMNIYLILMLSHYTWIRFSVWMVIGMLIYLLYGVKHSKQNPDFTGNIREEVEYTKLNEEGDEEATKSKLLD